MAHLFNRNVLLGVSGGIAAYKAAELVRQLTARGASVRVVMTRGAQEFITPLTLQALSGKPVHTELLDAEAEQGMGHIELARWADLLLIAPATADVIARLAGGRADDLLAAITLATAAPKVLAPAMNQQMWRDTATVTNTQILLERGYKIIGPAIGEQACGDIGPGRMEEPTTIASFVDNLFSSQLLAGKRLIVTAGPTREALDPVRYLSNHSSGKMGYALARAAAEAGAITTLISGPVQLATPAGVERIDIDSAQQMLAACEARIQQTDIFIACAAVADYRPKERQPQKIKKSDEQITLILVRNPDIIATIASHSSRPFTVGFAAETQAVTAYARSKLEQKRLDIIIANDVSRTDIGFGSDSNEVTVIWRDGQQRIPQSSKQNLAGELIRLIAKRYQTGNSEA
ncbi:MAG: bifunctional phosphopantothenoylcysteine decarboxylase/phosphopantothenate--cysteine ligase CoaBC [Parahaliea sp.]